MSVKSDLREFYDKNAKKYHQTRQKKRSDAKIIVDEINKYDKNTIKILELGCWWGRFLKYLIENTKKKIKYTWVDISKNLLDLTQKDSPDQKFVCSDMIDYITRPKQESFDFIIATASFQHISTPKDRMLILKNCYRILYYQWKVMMLNRAYSSRFTKKYKKQVLLSMRKHVYTVWRKIYRDVQVPRKSEDKTYYRYYHMFSLKELEDLAKRSGFVIEKISYLTKGWDVTQKQKNANNSILVATKSIFI